jgi:hypothetical protein
MYKLFVCLMMIVVAHSAVYAQKAVIQLTRGSNKSDSLYTLKVSNVSAVVDVNTGARVISLKLNDTELLGSKQIHPKFYGSTLWLSPEGKWKGQGPLDDGVYKKDFLNTTNVQLTSKNDTLRGFVFTKKFSVSAADTAIVITYTIKNIAAKAQEVSPWEVTRVPTGGLAFYPKGALSALAKSNLPVQDSLGLVWYPYDTDTKDHQKLYMKGDEGWIAYVHNGILFIKSFPPVNYNQIAPDEENVEIYVNQPKTYMELEDQGPFQSLKQNAFLTYRVKWYVRALPAGIKPEIGSKALIAYVRSIVKPHH